MSLVFTLVIKIHGGAIVTALGDVVRMTGGYDTGDSRHECNDTGAGGRKQSEIGEVSLVSQIVWLI